MAVEDEIVSVFAGVKGYLDNLPLAEIKKFEQESLSALKAHHPEYLAEIVKNKIISPELEAKLKDFYAEQLNNFKQTEKAA